MSREYAVDEHIDLLINCGRGCASSAEVCRFSRHFSTSGHHPWRVVVRTRRVRHLTSAMSEKRRLNPLDSEAFDTGPTTHR